MSNFYMASVCQEECELYMKNLNDKYLLELKWKTETT